MSNKEIALHEHLIRAGKAKTAAKAAAAKKNGKTEDQAMNYELNTFLKIPDAEYFSAAGLNHSTAKNIDKSSLYAKFEAGRPREATDAMNEGSYLHALILAPETCDQYVVAPKIDKRLQSGKDAWAKWLEENEGKKILTAEGHRRAHLMAESLRRKKSVKKLLDATTETEVAIFFERGGVLCKAKLDAITNNGIIWDIKSTKDASADGFGKSVANYSYHTQAEWYIYAANLTTQTFDQFAFAAVESEGFTDCQTFFISAAIIEEAIGINEERIEKWASCVEADFYPGYPETFQELEFPAWGFKKRGDY